MRCNNSGHLIKITGQAHSRPFTDSKEQQGVPRVDSGIKFITCFKFSSQIIGFVILHKPHPPQFHVSLYLVEVQRTSPIRSGTRSPYRIPQNNVTFSVEDGTWILKSVQADESLTKTCITRLKKPSNYAHLVSFSSSYRGASYQMPV